MRQAIAEQLAQTKRLKQQEQREQQNREPLEAAKAMLPIPAENLLLKTLFLKIVKKAKRKKQNLFRQGESRLLAKPVKKRLLLKQIAARQSL